MHEIFFLLAALVGIGLLGYLITIITPQLFSSIGLLMLAAGLAEGVPTGFWYHVVLRRILIERGNLPPRWWIHPTRHHAQLSPDEHRRIRLWFVLGGIGFFSSRGRHTGFDCDWSSDVCSSDLVGIATVTTLLERRGQFHRQILASHVDPLHPGFRAFVDATSQHLMVQGSPAAQASAQAHGLLDRKSVV